MTNVSIDQCTAGESGGGLLSVGDLTIVGSSFTSCKGESQHVATGYCYWHHCSSSRLLVFLAHLTYTEAPLTHSVGSNRSSSVSDAHSVMKDSD
jgi:hypothetical protein